MTDTVEDKKPSLLDYPEPSEDFNNKLAEKEIAKHAGQIKKYNLSDVEINEKLFLEVFK